MVTSGNDGMERRVTECYGELNCSWKTDPTPVEKRSERSDPRVRVL